MLERQKPFPRVPRAGPSESGMFIGLFDTFFSPIRLERRWLRVMQELLACCSDSQVTINVEILGRLMPCCFQYLHKNMDID
jgi:hypothetical protein